MSHDTLKITTIYTQQDSGQNCVLYIYTIFKDPHTLDQQFQPQQKPKPTTQCSHTRWRGESGNKMQRRQQNTSRPREMPSDKIKRVLVYGKDGTFRFSALSGKSERGRLDSYVRPNEALIHEEKKIRLTSKSPNWQSLEQA